MTWVDLTTIAVGTPATSTQYNNLVVNFGEVWRDLAYVEFDADVVSGGITFATGIEVVSAGALDFDGTAKARIEFYAPAMTTSTNNSSAQVSLADGGAAGTDLGIVVASANTDNTPAYGVREFTPPAGSKTYSFVLWMTISATGTARAGPGGAGERMPGFIRVTSKAAA